MNRQARARRLRMAATLVALVPLAAPRIARGEAAIGSMSLPEALAYARSHRPELRAAVDRVAAVKADAVVTRSRWYPTIGGSAQLLATTTNNTTGSYVGVSTFDNPRVSATRAESPSTASLVPEPSTLVGVGLRQEVFDFGRITAQAAADDLRADAERFSLETTRLVVDYDVEEAYFAVYAAQSVLTAAQTAYDRAALHRDLAKAGVESGMRRPIELTRAEATLDHYDLERVRAKRGVALAETVFAAAVGVPQPQLQIGATPPQPPDLPSLDRSFASAAEHNPELLAALARVRAQEQQTRAIRAELRPNLFVTGAISGNAGGAAPSSGESAPASGLLPVVPNWDVGLVLSWPLFDRSVSARADRSRIEEDVERDDAKALHLRVVSLVERAYLDVESARDALPILRHSLDAAAANYDQASARFNAGMGNAIELADAEELRTSAEIELALGTFDIARTRAELGRVIAEGI
jgi:outer membrane protein